MKDSLSLGVNRQAALDHAAALVAHAWQDFDNPRESDAQTLARTFTHNGTFLPH